MENQPRKNKKYCLKDFKSSLRVCKLFTDATGSIPRFLHQNLLDDARTVKIFRDDEHAFLKIFYFQFLKLCFETEDVDYDTKINKFIEAIEKNVELLRTDEKYCQGSLTGEGVKDILFEFLEILSQCKQPVEATLARYPAIGNILTNFLLGYLKTQLNVPPSSPLNTPLSIQLLSKQFQVQIVEYDSCIQFTDSQVYLYKESEEEVYMVYIDESKACRNTKMEASEEEGTGSGRSLDGSGFQVIRFQGPDVVFAEMDQSMVKVELDAFEKKDMVATNFISTACDSNTETMKQDPKSNTNRLSSLLTQEQKQNQPRSYMNITQQFTTTFILDTIVSQPYRTKIKEIKAKARHDRQSRKPFFV